MKSKAATISVTDKAEEVMVYIARVSNPSNQNNPNIAGLLRHCMKEGHWSVFEHAHWTVEINAPTFVTRQLLRHRSFSFSEFSQRYASPLQLGMADLHLRKQAVKNRQSSTEEIPRAQSLAFQQEIDDVVGQMITVYERMLEAGVARECARYILPMGMMSRLYMTGSARSWIHFLQVRTQEDVQKETREVALAIQRLFVEHFPLCGEALGWTKGSSDADETRVVSD